MAKRKKNGDPHPSTTGKSNPVANQTNWRDKLEATRIKFDDEQKIVYANALAGHGLKGRSAQTAGVCMQTVRKHLENDPDFAELVEEALETYRDKFVDHLTTLAYDGVLVKKYNKEGELIEERIDYPIRLIELEAKRVEPGYRDKQQIDINTGNTGVLLAPADKTPEQWVREALEENKTKQPPPGIEDKTKSDG